MQGMLLALDAERIHCAAGLSGVHGDSAHSRGGFGRVWSPTWFPEPSAAGARFPGYQAEVARDARGVAAGTSATLRCEISGSAVVGTFIGKSGLGIQPRLQWFQLN